MYIYIYTCIMCLCVFIICLFIKAYAAAGDAPVFVDSAIFERLEHFKDFGLPATLQDPIA